MTARTATEIVPSAARLLGSLRDLGYDLPSAIADLVDNSISAGARRVSIRFEYAGQGSTIEVVDDGNGMAPISVKEALRLGTRREYERAELGRFGLGLKTASLSIGRRLTVCSRQSPRQQRIAGFSLDLDHVLETDRWELVKPSKGHMDRGRQLLAERPGTVVVIDNLDRLLSGTNPDRGWARRRVEAAAAEAEEHLAMVFHRYLEGPRPKLRLLINGRRIAAWNPFAVDEPATRALPPVRFTIEADGKAYPVDVAPFVLPSRGQFSSSEAFDQAAGPRRWNRQQGLYFYRERRLVQAGGWSGFRALDEHLKLARMAIEFPRELDRAFQVNIAKMRVIVPSEVRPRLERAISDLVHVAQDRYRHVADREVRRATVVPTTTSAAVGLALRDSADRTGQESALEVIMRDLALRRPQIADALGWTDPLPVRSAQSQ